MAETGVRFVRDCVNPALVVERVANGDVVALHVTGKDALLRSPPPVVIVDGVRYEPVTA